MRKGKEFFYTFNADSVNIQFENKVDGAKVIWTHNPRIMKPVLNQLSYLGSLKFNNWKWVETQVSVNC